eukprot:g4020.t1
MHKLVQSHCRVLNPEKGARYRKLKDRLAELDQQIDEGKNSKESSEEYWKLQSEVESLSKYQIPASWQILGALSQLPMDTIPYATDLSLCNIENIAFLKETLLDPLQVSLGNSKKKCFNVHLDLSINQIKDLHDISPVTDMTRSLDVSVNFIKVINNLHNMTNLRVLNISNNEVKKISGLEKCVNLYEIDISGNNVETISGLEALINLKVLNLSNNCIKTLSGLHVCPKLMDLNLSSNELENVDHLSMVPSLTKVNLSENKLVDLPRLSKTIMTLKNLVEVKCIDNPVNEDDAFFFSILANEGISILNNTKVRPDLREHLQKLGKQNDLKLIIDQTVNIFNARNDKAKYYRDQVKKYFKDKLKEFDEQFLEFQEINDDTLNECRQYIQSIMLDPKKAATSWLYTENGIEEWKTIIADNLSKELDVTENRSDQLKDRAQKEANAFSYLQKLKVLSKEQPALWQDLKRKEAANARLEAKEDGKKTVAVTKDAEMEAERQENQLREQKTRQERALKLAVEEEISDIGID